MHWWYSMELTRVRHVLCYKILFGLLQLSYSDFFTLSSVTVTRGRQYKLYVKRSHGVMKHLFAERIVAPWNCLPAEVVDFSSRNRFKRSIELVDLSKFFKIDIDT